MKTLIKLFKIILVFILLTASLNISYAGKEELKTPEEKGESINSFGADEVREACKYFDSNNNGHISLDEFKDKVENNKNKDKTDKYLTIMNVFTGEDDFGEANTLPKAFEANNGYIKEIVQDNEGGHTRVNEELLKAIKEEYNKRRKEAGLDEIEDNFWDEVQEKYEDEIFTAQPSRSDAGRNAGSSINDLMGDAESFVNQGDTSQLPASDLQDFSSVIYNILLTVGIVVAVIVGAIIGVKLMASNIDTKVEAKKLLIPYVVGCVVVFGAFVIWKIVVTMLQGM